MPVNAADGYRGMTLVVKITHHGPDEEEQQDAQSDNDMAQVKAGDRIRIETPGGGGWGTTDNTDRSSYGECSVVSRR